MASVDLPDRVLDIEVPDELIADGPVEADGRRRDDVRMLVARRASGDLVHARARDLAAFLDPGDVLVVNTSPTLPAAVRTVDERLLVHFSTDHGDGRWIVEVRDPVCRGSRPHPLGRQHTLALSGGAELRLVRPYSPMAADGARLWEAQVTTPVPFAAWLAGEGRPIRYGDTCTAWPLDAYQTVFASHPDGDPGLGSAEMPSAGRPFTPELLTSLIGRGVLFAPITLHTGVSSLEAHEPPYAERYVVPAATARLVDEAHARGNKVIAVGTTPTRALETDATTGGRAHAGEGWTELVITPERGLRVVDGIISGWHEPEASHLLLMEAVAGRPLLESSYAAAVAQRYRWHEFGDIHLVLP
jgi:S-adenosylmethionine:tRNA ribosyltransferase-isomerase